MQAKPKIFIIVMAIVFVLCSVLCPVIGIISANGGLGGSSLSGKYSKVDIGDNRTDVEDAIGKPYDTKFGYTYYSKKYMDLQEKIDNCMDLGEAIKLEAELSELQFDKLTIIFDDKLNQVSRVTYYKEITELGSDNSGIMKKTEIKILNNVEYYEVETDKGYKEKSTVSGSLIIDGFDNNKFQTSIYTSFGKANVYISTSSLNNASEFSLKEGNGYATVEIDNSESNMLLIDMNVSSSSYTEDSNFVSSLKSIIQHFRSQGKTIKLMCYKPGDKYYEILTSLVNEGRPVRSEENRP